ncbi:hypothetical protein EGW08_022814, partial [Elysia chlorotica]
SFALESTLSVHYQLPRSFLVYFLHFIVQVIAAQSFKLTSFHVLQSVRSAMATFVDKNYSSFQEFSSSFEEFKKTNHCMFRTKSSETVAKANLKSKNQIPAHFVYSRIDYVCTHYGEPRVRGNGVKSRTKHSATGCKASFVLKYNYYEKHLAVINVHLEHNHPTTPETFAQEYQVKRLGQAERKSLQDLVELNPRNEPLMHMVNSKFHKSFTLAEIRRLKHQLKSDRARGDVDDLLDKLEDLQAHGQVKVIISDNGSGSLFDVVAFSTSHMSSLFSKYPDVIYMDGTYKTNKCGYPLYQVMVEDGCGRGRAVFYAFVRQENADILSKMMATFAEFMGESVNHTKYAMTDKDPNEMNAIRQHLPHASNVLCAFHVHKAMKARLQKLQCSKEVRDRLQQLSYLLVTTNDIATFQRHVVAIKSLSPEFYDYIDNHWLNCIDLWAYHARLHSRLYFNDTNNKCEGENRRLKEILNSNTSMAVAVKKLFQHSLTQQLDVRAASAVETMSSIHFRDANPRWQSLYSMFSSHAVQLMLQDHVSFPVPAVAEADGFDCLDASGVHYHVIGRPLSCLCPFYCQTSLPCHHMLSVFALSFDIVQSDLYAPDNRWLKQNVVEDVPLPQVHTVSMHSLVGPEARHHRTEAVLARLSNLLKGSGSLQFMERIEKVERVVEAWEDGRDCVVLDVEVVADGAVVQEELVADGAVVQEELVANGAVVEEELVAGGSVVEEELVAGGSVVEEEVVAERELSLRDVRDLNVQLPLVRKRGRPKMLRTRSYKKSKRVRFNSDVCYVCFQEEVSRELCTDGSVMDWVGCSRCPRWFHSVCIDALPASESWVCSFCSSVTS